MAGPAAVGLPASTRLVLDRSVRRVDGGRVLIGGSPIRLMRLSESGARVVDRLADGAPLGESAAVSRLARRLLDAGMAHPLIEPSCARIAEVTVVIPTLGRPDGLARTLASLAADGVVPTRILVVDDGSTAADAEAIAEVVAAAGAELLRRPVNGGPAAARNDGLATITTPLVAFVDADVEPEPGWLAALLPHFDDEAVVAVAPRVRPSGSDGGPVPSDARGAFERSSSPLDLGAEPARVAPRTRVAYVPTTTLLVRVDALQRLDGFDEALQFGEDVDLVWRLVEDGGTVRFDPSATVRHPVRRDLSGWLRQRLDYGASAAPLAARHPGALAPVSVSVWSALAWLAAASGHVVVGAAVGAGAAAQLPARLTGLDHPWAEGLRLAGGGTWSAWRPLASAVTRTWWPLALAALLVSRRARRVVIAAAVVPPLVDWWQGDRELDPVRSVGLHLLDDLAYGSGVWAGCARERTIDPLRPDLHSWPGRQPAIESP